MPILLLIRHGENDYLKKARLPGRLPGIRLNDAGRQQAAELAQTLSGIPLKALYSSPLERAVETAEPLAQSHHLEIRLEPGLMDTDVGKWQGRSWKVLRRTKVWRVVQQAPSRFRFPEGESFYQAQTRVVATLDRIAAAHQPQDLVAVVCHADPIKLAVAHYIGLPLDHVQRLVVDTGSVTALAIGEDGARLLWLNRRPPFELRLPRKAPRKKK